MNIEKYRPFIVIVIISIILIMVGMMLVRSEKNDINQTSSTEEPIIIEEAFSTEQSVWETEPSSELLVTDEIKLLYYYIFLRQAKFRDILTEAEIAIIIDELKQFQPEALNKLLYHDAEMFQMLEKNISVTQFSSPNPEYARHYVNYKYNDTEYKISFSETIEQVWLRGRTEEWHTNLLPEFPDDGGPLFVKLTNANNNNIIPLIQFFLDNGVDINMQNPKFGNTIFSSAGTLEIAQFLIANGADPTVVTNSGATPLIHAISGEDSNELIKLLIDLGVDLHAKSSFYGTALDEAKDTVRILERDYYEMDNTDIKYDNPDLFNSFPARIEKAE
ncbi:MAG: ankyrin repeat domain-containing protein, partial [Alphaproteobacteria bacterium]|nr:ankyrin repeat domain-containing protein [Alphaproteobacteria bacterium]